MKQAADKFTIDMFADKAPATSRYRFYVRKTDGTTVEWLHLTKTMARNMYSYTRSHQPCDVVAFGWAEQH